MNEIRFHIKTQKSKHYFEVFVFYNRKALLSHVQIDDLNIHQELSTEDYEALTLPHKIDYRGNIKYHIGKVYLHKKQLTPLTVIDEMVHCGMWYERLVGNNPNGFYGNECNENEEQLAETVAQFTQSFYRQVTKRKLL